MWFDYHISAGAYNFVTHSTYFIYCYMALNTVKGTQWERKPTATISLAIISF